jgi:Temperature dependent protein affecting M2 dsRNA replication
LAVNAYLNDVVGSPSGQKQSVVQHHEKESFKYALDYPADLKKAFSLWDAIYDGVKAGGDLVKDRKAFDDANKWLADMRYTS